MEPLLPRDPTGELTALAIDLLRESAALGASVHPITRRGIAGLLRAMNCYYSNLIEGHNTRPADIERALRNDFSHDPAQRALQIESLAHIQVQERLERRLLNDPAVDICHRDFLSWVHRELYERFPDEFRVVKTRGGGEAQVVPGELRDGEVQVGRHLAPAHDSLELFLARFHEGYRPERLSPTQRIIAAAASHHRFAWIHPFLDGNGRVVRLHTDAYFVKAKADGQGLWTVSRGLARQRDAYLTALARADLQRHSDLDGRGNLSDEELQSFCRFFLETALDQVRFMAGSLELDSIQRRISAYAERHAAFSGLPPEIGRLLCDAFLRGQLPRGEAMRVLSKPERTSRRIVRRLLEDGLLESEAPGRPLRLAFPTTALGYYFPRLYPEGVEV